MKYHLDFYSPGSGKVTPWQWVCKLTSVKAGMIWGFNAHYRNGIMTLHHHGLQPLGRVRQLHAIRPTLKPIE